MLYTDVSLYGSSVLCRYIDSDNVRRQSKFKYKPTLYVRSDEETEFKTLTGKNASPVEFDSIREARDFVKTYDGVSNFEIYNGDVPFQYQFICDTFPGELTAKKKSLRIFTIDIETESEYGFPVATSPREKINVITIHVSTNNKFYVWVMGEFTPTDIDEKGHHVSKDEIIVEQHTDETAMLKSVLQFWSSNHPDVITGWYTSGFDIPYMYARAKELCGDDAVKKLSPWNMVHDDIKTVNSHERLEVDIIGVQHLDYMELYKKFTYTRRESYKLGFIAHVELDKTKLDNPYEGFKEFYTKDFERFIKYNIIDASLVVELDAKLALIDVVLIIAYSSKCNFADAFSPVRTWECMIYNHMQSHKQVTERKKHLGKEPYDGAYVKIPTPGFYEWIVSFDVASMYPHIIMGWNMSPETFTKPMPGKQITTDDFLSLSADLSWLPKNECIAANNMRYRTDINGIMPDLTNTMFNLRTVYKQQMLDFQKKEQSATDKDEKQSWRDAANLCEVKQKAIKILLNSLYGAMANEYFRYYRLETAEAITLTGQLIIKYIGNEIDRTLNNALGTTGVEYTIYQDTDAIYVNFAPLVKHYGWADDDIVDKIDALCKQKIEPFIVKMFERLSKYMGCVSNKIFMKREVISNTSFWLAKKRYCMSVIDSEGVRYTKPKIKIMGIEAVRSDTPEICRDKIKAAVELILKKDQAGLRKLVDDFRKEFDRLPAEDIAAPKGVNGIEKYQTATSWKSKTPIHVRASIVWNRLIKDRGLDKIYPMIRSGDKIKWVYLKVPNPVNQDVFAFPDSMPASLDMDKYIDRKTQFDKKFFLPVQTMMDTVGWNSTRTHTFSNLFE